MFCFYTSKVDFFKLKNYNNPDYKKKNTIIFKIIVKYFNL